MADESAFNLEQVKQLQQHQAVDIINIKLMKAGGLYPAMQIADYCAQHNILCMIGCMLEGSIGVAAAAHLAAAYPDTIKLIDLDGPTLGQYDPVNNATHFVDAHIHLNTRFGLGIDEDLALPLWEG
jgi:L-alanine-DL-glutamate epimerase-like enolase superfamily enzyme